MQHHRSLEYWHGISVCLTPKARHSYWSHRSSTCQLVQLSACCRHTHATVILYCQVRKMPAWTPHPPVTPVQTQTQTHKVESEVVKEGVNKKTGETSVLRSSAQSDKHTDWPHFTHNLPPYTHLSLFPPSLTPAFLPLGIPSSVCIFLSPSPTVFITHNTQDCQVQVACRLLISHQLLWLMRFVQAGLVPGVAVGVYCMAVGLDGL